MEFEEVGDSELANLTCILGQPGRYEIAWTAHDEPRSTLWGSAGANTMPISRPVYEEILFALGTRAPEVGGVLLGPKNNRLVTHFIFDEGGQSADTTFTLDHLGLNQIIAPYLSCNLDIKGFVHSHPSGYPRPSTGDREYLARLLSNPRNQTEELFFPIQCDGRLQAFIVTPGSLRVDRQWAIPARIHLI